MTTARIIALLITLTIFHASRVRCSSVVNEATTKLNSSPSPTPFVHLTAKRINATTVLIAWTSGEHGDFQNATVQFRRSGGIDWQNSNSTWIYPSNNSSRSQYFDLSSPCLAYEIRLRASVGIGDVGKYYFSESVISNSPTIPDRTEPTRPGITKNIYNNSTDTIELVFSIENHILASWPPDSRHLTTEVHVVECGGSTDDNEEFVAPVPFVQWSSSSKGLLRFAEPYVGIVRSGRSCKVMISVKGPAKVCGHSLVIDGELLNNAVLVEMSCAATQNAPCSLAAAKPKKTPPPRCNPELVVASKVPVEEGISETAADELRVRWDFGKNRSTGPAPQRVILRFGYTEVPVDADPLLAMLVPMHEIERFEADGSETNTTLRSRKSVPEFGAEQKQAQRFYKISVCAVYGNDSSAEEQKINWGIIPTFPVKTKSQEGDENNPQKQCRCEESNQSPARDKNADSTVFSTTTAPPIVSAPSHQYENYWLKVTPLLAVFTLMTVINLVLLTASYYYYKKARHLNAVK